MAKKHREQQGRVQNRHGKTGAPISRKIRPRPVRFYAEGENFGGRLLVGVFALLLYGLFRLLYGP